MATPLATPDREQANWFGSDVGVKDVIAQMAELRARTSHGPAPLAVSSVLNLVAIAPTDDELNEIEDTIGDLAEHQPSRAVVLSEGQEGDDTGIDANVNVSCLMGDGNRQVCVEQVTLTVRGAARGGVASAVEPLLRNDLPTFVWWPGPPEVAHDVLDAVCSLADRLVTEGSRSDDPAAALAGLHARIVAGGPAVTDLAWAAITPWRQMLSQMLGPSELERLAAGPAVLHIASRGRTPSLDAHLLAGWLGHALGDRLAVEHSPRPKADEGIVAVELESASGRRLAVERIEGRAAAAVSVSSPAGRPRRRVLPMPVPVRSRLLAGELEYIERDDAFEHAVNAAMELTP